MGWDEAFHLISSASNRLSCTLLSISLQLAAGLLVPSKALAVEHVRVKVLRNRVQIQLVHVIALVAVMARRSVVHPARSIGMGVCLCVCMLDLMCVRVRET